MADHKRDAARGEPFDAFGYQQHITDPGENKGKYHSDPDLARTKRVKRQQKQKDKRFCTVPHWSILLQRGIQMHACDYEKQY